MFAPKNALVYCRCKRGCWDTGLVASHSEAFMCPSFLLARSWGSDSIRQTRETVEHLPVCASRSLIPTYHQTYTPYIYIYIIATALRLRAKPTSRRGLLPAWRGKYVDQEATSNSTHRRWMNGRCTHWFASTCIPFCVEHQRWLFGPVGSFF